MWVHIGSEGQIKNLKNNHSFQLTRAFEVWKLRTYILNTRNQKSNHTSYCLLHKQPWRSEAWEGQGRANLLVTRGLFYKTINYN